MIKGTKIDTIRSVATKQTLGKEVLMKRKTIMSVTGMLLLVFAIVIGSTNVYAASLNSSQMKKIKNLVSSTLPLTMSSFYGQNAVKKRKSRTFNFSKASDRKKVLYGVYGDLSSKDLFGIKMEKVTDDTGKYYGIYYADTGNAIFMYKNYQYRNDGSGKYNVTADFFFELDDDGYKNSGKLGTAVFTIQKNSKSKYGYVLRKMTIKKTSNTYPWG